MILGFALGAFAAGTLSDRMGRRLPVLRSLALLFLGCWTPWVLGWQLPHAASLAAFTLMGISMAGSVVCWALAKELNPPSLAGTATSFVNTAGFIGVALLQPAVGWILDLSIAEPALEGYRRAAGLLALTALIGVVAAFQLRETRCRNIYAELRRT